MSILLLIVIIIVVISTTVLKDEYMDYQKVMKSLKLNSSSF